MDFCFSLLTNYRIKMKPSRVSRKSKCFSSLEQCYSKTAELYKFLHVERKDPSKSDR